MHRILGTAALTAQCSDSFKRLYLNDYHYAPNAMRGGLVALFARHQTVVFLCQTAKVESSTERRRVIYIIGCSILPPPPLINPSCGRKSAPYI